MACPQVTLRECDTFDLRVLTGPSDYVAAAGSTETTEKMEACMKVWIKQIEQVRRVPSQVRGHPQIPVHLRTRCPSLLVCCCAASTFRHILKGDICHLIFP